MEVPNDLVNEIRLSPFLVAVVAASATIGLSNPATGQTVDRTSLAADSVGSSSASANVRSVSQPENLNQYLVPQPVRVSSQTGNLAVQTISGPKFSPTEPTTIQRPTPRINLPNELPVVQKPTPTINSVETVWLTGKMPMPQIQRPTPTLNPLAQQPLEERPPTLTLPSQPPVPPTNSIPTLTPAPTPTLQPAPVSPSQPAPVEEPRVLVGEVAVIGAQGQLSEELVDKVYRAIRTRPGRAATRTQLQEDVAAIYAIGLFAKANFLVEDTPLGVRVTFVVESNPLLRQVSVKTVPENGTRVLPEKVVNDIFSPQYGHLLNLQDFQESIKKLNQWYKDNGYELAQVVEVPQVSPDGAVTLVVSEGVIEDIRVRFLNKEGQSTDAEGKPFQGRTREFIITRELQVKPGEVFNRNTVLRDLRRLAGLGIFELSQESPSLSLDQAQDPRKVVIVVNVIEKNTGSIAAGAGISSASGLFGTISYQEQNLGGNNQKLGAELQVGQRDLLFDVNFTDPWIAGDPYRTAYTVNAFQRRTISLIFDGGKQTVTLPNGDVPRVVRFGGGVTFSRPLTPDPFDPNPEWRGSLGFQYQRISINDSNGNLTPKDQLGNELSFSKQGQDDLLMLQLGLVRDLRNDPLRPSQGSVLRFGVDQSVPVGLGNIFMNRVRGSYSFYLPVKYTNFSEGPQTLAFNIQAGTVLGDLPPYEAFSLGGSNSVRGYDEGNVGAGRSYVQASAEYRFPLFAIIDGALFVDAASDLGTASSVPGNPGGVRRKPGSGFGYGLGVRVQTPLGPIRLDYGINDLGESRIHFGIGERF